MNRLSCAFILCASFLSTFACAKELNEMTLEEKVGQLFMAYFEGEEYNEAAKKLIVDAKFGGIIYYNWSNGLTQPDKVQRLSYDLQESALKQHGIPLFIATDQEGGIVSRLQEGFTEFPGNAALGATEDPELAYQSAKFMAQELQSVGVNLNLAPVVDVNSNPDNPIIGIRSYHSNPHQVVRFAKAALNGYAESGILACLKHFPGHGDVTIDSHIGRPILQKPLEKIEQTDLYPFAKLASQAPAIMTAHILFPALDPDHVATLSKRISTELLREGLGFEGLLISDSLTMKGATEGYANLEDVFIQAFEAGNDILLIGGRSLQHKVDNESNLEEILKIHACFLEAARKGRISEDRIDQSVARILKAKSTLVQAPLSKNELRERATVESKALAKEIAYRSVQVKEGLFPQDIAKQKVLLVYSDVLTEPLLKSKIKQLSNQLISTSFKGLNPAESEKEEILQKATVVQTIVFCSYNAWKNPQQQELLKELSLKAPLILVAARDPYDLACLQSHQVAFATLSPTSVSLDVVAEYLLSETSPFDLDLENAQKVSQLIWKNECNNRVDQLTFWNEKEPFPSMGIGHFIWPPQSYTGTFIKGRFHYVIEFMKEKGIAIPKWLLESRYCPWETREVFYKEFESKKMQELREFLVHTAPYQAMYMLIRLNHFFKDLTLVTSPSQRPLLYKRFFKVYHSPKGPYILIDYLNFKHEGVDPKERYSGKGWGLLQVLQNMNDVKNPAEAFVESAKQVLEQRVNLSPAPQVEKKWVLGWWNRLHTYL